MIRPCFLVVDKEYPGSISTRKLVIETAHMNVLTAYSAGEAVEMLQRFGGVDGIVLDSETRGQDCRELIAQLRHMQEGIPIVTVSPSGYDACGGEDYHVSGYDPRKLLDVLQQVCSEAPNIRAKDEARAEELEF